MSSNNKFFRNVFLGLLCVVGLVSIVSSLLNPASMPTFVREPVVWVRANSTMFYWLMVGLAVVDFVVTVSRFQAETKGRLSDLEKRVAKLDRQSSDRDAQP